MDVKRTNSVAPIASHEVRVASVPQGYKGGAVLKTEPTNPWMLCSHFHRSPKAAGDCGRAELKRMQKAWESSQHLTTKVPDGCCCHYGKAMCVDCLQGNHRGKCAS